MNENNNNANANNEQPKTDAPKKSIWGYIKGSIKWVAIGTAGIALGLGGYAIGKNGVVTPKAAPAV